jgi:2-amino-4-hydroxy-6-hydroxymethyldihydropteridine diphosphokinase
MAALKSLQDHPAVLELRASGFYRSAPVQAQGPDFINAVALIHTRLDAYELLHVMQQLEHQAGRERPYPNAPRTLDLDLLLFDDLHQPDSALTLPHPRMWGRAFVLLPLHELAPELVSPARLQAVADQRIVRISPG